MILFSKTISDNIKANSALILGISGGPDSVFLLHQCLEINKKYGFKLIVAHVNHGLRPKNSERDADFVEKLAKKNHLTFESIKLNLAAKQKHGFEEAGRILRYEFFEKLRKKHKAAWILTAHHLDDNIETVLFNLIRGANLTGLKGMETVSSKKHLLRPMLRLSKAEIVRYLQQRKITYKIDETNENLNFSRNWLRKKVIPLFKKINGSFEKTFASNIENFADLADFLSTCSAEWLKKHTPKNGFLLDEFLQIHPALQKNILVHLYKKTHGSTRQLTNKNLREILRVLQQKKANCKKEFGPGYFMSIIRNAKNQRIVTLKKNPKRLE